MTETTYEVTIRLDDDDCEVPTERDVQVAVQRMIEKDPGFAGVQAGVEAVQL